MANIYDIGVSGLKTNQRIIATVGHNISNVNTEGYSRQRVEVVARVPQLAGNGYVGKGVMAADVTRMVDDFLNAQVRTSAANQSKAAALYGFASQVSNLLADASAGLAPALADFFNGIQDLADDPSSIPARSVALDEARTLVSRFQSMSGQIDRIYDGVNQNLVDRVEEVNALASSIARLNGDIVQMANKANGRMPNDLLDQRDRLVNELSRLVGTTVVPQADGALNVSVGNGQVLVAGTAAIPLTVINDPLDASRLDVAYTIGSTTVGISNNLTGGEIGGVLDFRNRILDPARNSLGRTAVALAQTFNAQHREGMDLNGALGGDFFGIPAPAVAADPANTGTVTVDFNPADVGGLTTANYRLVREAGSFTLTNLSTGATTSLAGAGPFDVDGLTITVGAAPAVGDAYLIQPTRYAARELTLAVTSPAAIAAAAPVRTAVSAANIGDARISGGEVLDVTDVNLLATVNLVFDSPTTYQVNGVGPSIPYTPGGDIDLNGWRVQVSGTPQAGDTFTVRSNAGGRSDNRNALLLGDLQTRKILEGGTSTYQDSYGELVSQVGSATRQAEIAVTALTSLHNSAVDAQQQVSGVNLDEEAANLLRYQQAYQAAAQVVMAADSIFQTLLQAVQR